MEPYNKITIAKTLRLSQLIQDDDFFTIPITFNLKIKSIQLRKAIIEDIA